MCRALTRIVLGVAALVAVLPAPAAAFPGENGKVLFFSRDPGSPSRDLWTINPDGTDLSRLTNTPPHERNANWSADGRRIVYTLNDSGDFIVTDANGIEQFRVDAPELSFDPAWSPRGDEIAYSKWAIPPCPDPFFCIPAPEEIRAVRTDGTNDRLVVSARGIDPAWSPDGGRIAFVAGATGGPGAGLNDVWVVNADGSGLVDITASSHPAPYAEENPQWSPDGTRLVFTGWVVTPDYGACCSPNRELFSIKADGTGLDRLTRTPLQEFFPAWSPDGSKIAFSASNPDLSGGAGLFMMNADGTNPKQISGMDAVEIDWQPVPNNPPVCAGVVASTDSLGPPNHKLVSIALDGASDPDGDAVTLEVTSVSQDEPTGGSPDAFRPGAANEVRLRAERDGSGDGRVYRVSFRASDPAGATCRGEVEVAVDKGRADALDSAPPSYDSFGD